MEEGGDEEQPEEEGARAEGQETVPTPEDQGGDCLEASVSRIRNVIGTDPDPRIYESLVTLTRQEKVFLIITF